MSKAILTALGLAAAFWALEAWLFWMEIAP